MPTTVNAVIYARYSSHSQTEQSIEGQLHDAYAYAERNGYRVISEYIDRALTGTKDTRPDFQRMIKDAEKRQFQVVIVWKLDRFARNRYDSAFYKAKLKKCGVRVVSVMENIPETPEGIILEGLLESMAEYYSANLSENIRRGQQESIKKGWFCGGSIPHGYRVQDHRLVEDERTSPVVKELYRRYADGDSLADIARDLNARGYRTRRGHEFCVSTFDNMMPNPAYIGRYTYAGTVVPELAVPLIDQETYDRCVQRRMANRRAPAANRSTVDYLLQGKLFCGHCGSLMCGDAGTSKTGIRHLYYSCSARKHRKGNCKKKAEKKDFIEWYVCEQTVLYILDPERMDFIAGAVVDVYNSDIDNEKINALQRTVKRLNDELNLLVDRLATVPQSAVPRITERMALLEAQRIDAETDLTKLKIQQRIRITKKEVTAWLSTFQNGDLMDPAFRLRIIETFVNSVYLYDDKIVIFFNIQGGQETAAFDPLDELDELNEENPSAVEGSTLEGNGGAFPVKVEHHKYLVFVHGMLGLYIKR